MRVLADNLRPTFYNPTGLALIVPRLSPIFSTHVARNIGEPGVYHHRPVMTRYVSFTQNSQHMKAFVISINIDQEMSATTMKHFEQTTEY